MIQKQKAHTVILSSCICQNTATFIPAIIYKNETVFKNYEEIIIGKCTHCGILKTLSSSIDSQQSHIEIYSKETDNYRKLFLPLVGAIKKYKHQGTVLDVGCANGILLKLLREYGYDVYGIEPNIQAFKEARKEFGKRVYNGTTKDFQSKHKELYDIIIYNHVLEHVSDINSEFTYIKKLLKPNGILIIGVPNTNNIVFKLRKKYWESLLPLEHIWHFSDVYLKEYMHQHNFKILSSLYSNHTRTDYPLLKRIYFSMLCFVNRVLKTGESVTIISQA